MSDIRARARGAALLSLALLAAGPARADSDQAEPVAPQTPTPAPSEAAPTSGDANLFGTLGGLRPLLATHGISLGLVDINDVLANPSGGIRQGAIYEGNLEATIGVDLGAAIGLAGGSLNITGFGIFGRGLSGNNIGNLQTVTELEADRTVRLFEAWYEQAFLGGKITLRLGELAADQEFIVTQYGSVFFNSSFGFPDLPAVDLPAGGPAYPFAAPGIRLKLAPDSADALLLALFSGNPAPGSAADPQVDNAYGTVFPLHSGALLFAEWQHALALGPTRLPGTVKFGAWWNSNNFADQALDLHGQSLAAPGASPLPLAHHGDESVYAVIDQLITRAGTGPNAGIGAFLRAMWAPSDRNRVDAFIDGGLTWRGPLPGRPDDTAGIGVGWDRISPRARTLDLATRAYGGAPYPIRSGETLVELTYQATIRPWWQVQPDLQLILRPAGGVPDPLDPSHPIGDALVLGLRSSVTF